MLFRSNVKGRKVLAGFALAKLDPSIFDKVMRNELNERHAVIVGEGGLDIPAQVAVVEYIQSREKSGSTLTEEGIREAVRRAGKSETKVEVVDTLFGPDERAVSLFGEEVELVGVIRRRLTQEKNLFGVVGRQAAADRLGQAGNKIQAEANAAIATEAEQALAVFSKLLDNAGPIADAEIGRASCRERV